MRAAQLLTERQAIAPILISLFAGCLSASAMAQEPGRAYVANIASYSISVIDTHADGVTDSNPDPDSECNAVGHPDAFANQHADRITHPDAKPDPFSQRDCNSHAHGHPHTNGHADNSDLRWRLR